MLNNVLKNLSLKFQKLTSDNNIRDISLICIVYTFCHGLSLFNTGIFWDEWIYAVLDKTAIDSHFIQLGNPLLGDYLYVIFSLPYGITIFRLITFFSFLIATLAFYGILKSIKNINRDAIVILCILFAVIPVNFARISIATNLHSICYGFFFLAWYLLTKYLETGKLQFRIYALLLFFVSFQTQSLLFFFIIPVFFIAYRSREDILTIKSFIRCYARYVDFLILPILFFGLKNIYWKQFGIYAGIYQLSVQNFLLIPANFINSSYLTIMYTLSRCYQFIRSLDSHILECVLFCIFFVMILYLIRKRNIITGGSPKKDLLLIFAGFGFFLIGMFPYLAVGYMPNYLTWDSRHQLLFPLGVSIVLFYTISLFSKKLSLSKKTVQIIFSLLISGFIIINAGSYLDYQRDAFKQESYLIYFNESDIIRNYSTFLFNDTTQSTLNANARSVAFYEYTGMMKYVFKNDNRLGIPLPEFQVHAKNNMSYFKGTELWNYQNYSFRDPQYIFTIRQGTTSLDPTSILILMYEQYMMPEKFLSKVRNITTMSYEIYLPESGNKDR